MPLQEYVGSELSLFADVRHWKAYWGGQVLPYLQGTILEVGAGLGANALSLCRPDRHSRWVCLEPDRSLSEEIRASIGRRDLPECVEVVEGTIQDLPSGSLFDAVLYADVLEHIEDDRGQLALAFSLLRPGGFLVVLSPAHQSLYSEFDRSIGHFRRYDRRSLTAISPRRAELARLRYLDSVGMATSFANRTLLSQPLPTRRQLAFWDRFIVPISRVLDPLIGYRLGRSILAVWRRTN